MEWTPPDAAGIPTDVTWVLKAFEDVPKKEALEAERTAAKLLRKYGGEGRASSNAGLDEFSLIVARGIGEPLDKNPNAPANLEALVPSAAAVVQEYAKLGWLHKYVSNRFAEDSKLTTRCSPLVIFIQAM